MYIDDDDSGSLACPLLRLNEATNERVALGSGLPRPATRLKSPARTPPLLLRRSYGCSSLALPQVLARRTRLSPSTRRRRDSVAASRKPLSH